VFPCRHFDGDSTVCYCFLILFFSYRVSSENLTAQKAQNNRRINLELHKQIIDEVKIGLWTIEQAQEKIKMLENVDSPHPSKHQKQAVREPSPDWAEISSGSDDF
jgi:hypothetical protein